MTDWRAEYGKRFQQRCEQASRENARSIQKQGSIENGQDQLWSKLHDEAKRATEQIAIDCGSSLSFFDIDPLEHKNGFRVLYHLEGAKDHSAEAVFKKASHTLTVNVSNPSSTDWHQELKVTVGNGGDLLWDSHANDSLLRQIFSHLL